jgi:hypothetical protein
LRTRRTEIPGINGVFLAKGIVTESLSFCRTGCACLESHETGIRIGNTLAGFALRFHRGTNEHIMTLCTPVPMDQATTMNRTLAVVHVELDGVLFFSSASGKLKKESGPQTVQVVCQV